ncbi:MAG: hypothetical protein PF589_09910 [Gammaproteobacteria bacterium]|jgi:hypothetical protein|nr:hypothetical protein [Gammaproteobacteria bacterium]
MKNSLPNYRDSGEPKTPALLVQPATESVPSQMQPVSAEEGGGLMVFFGIGMVINIVMILAFFIWAIKQWRKHDAAKK